MSMPSRKDLLKTFLKGIETGSAMAAAVVDEERYIQHNPQTPEGGPGIAALFARIAKTQPKVTFARVFEDGDFAFAHNEYDFADVKIAFEVFRFEGDRAVEHWDNIQPVAGPNPSGRGMLDGSTEIRDHDKTEDNRRLVHSFARKILRGGAFSEFSSFVAANLVQHDPELADGHMSLLNALEPGAHGKPSRRYDVLHRVLAEGNFVLCMSEGEKDGVHSGFYDLFRVDEGKIVEHWTTIEAIPPHDLRKNNNGKF